MNVPLLPGSRQILFYEQVTQLALQQILHQGAGSRLYLLAMDGGDPHRINLVGSSSPDISTLADELIREREALLDAYALVTCLPSTATAPAGCARLLTEFCLREEDIALLQEQDYCLQPQAMLLPTRQAPIPCCSRFSRSRGTDEAWRRVCRLPALIYLQFMAHDTGLQDAHVRQLQHWLLTQVGVAHAPTARLILEAIAELPASVTQLAQNHSQLDTELQAAHRALEGLFSREDRHLIRVFIGTLMRWLQGMAAQSIAPPCAAAPGEAILHTTTDALIPACGQAP